MIDRQIRELLAKQALYELVVRYCRGIDRADPELVASCYHPGAIEEHGPYSGSAEGWIEVLCASTLDTGRRPNPVQHSVSNTLFEIDGDVAHGETYVEVRRVEGGRRYIEGHGRYIDRFERRDGEWRIARRRSVVEYVGPDHVLDDFIPGSRDRGDPSYDRR